GEFSWPSWRYLAMLSVACSHSSHSGVQLNRNPDGASRLLNLFTSSQNISDELLDRWAERAEAIGPEAVGSVLCPHAHAVADGNTSYDHASAFLQALLKKLDQT
ncbi:hypothetical protein, partial [Bradyrhizobium sp. SZCCHNG3015]|uniref:hypothetical protein n=1 Tax=Bradyrhizobium sp. SZCCHNG3015 TaxID=3057270 RepID=UPI0028E29C85